MSRTRPLPSLTVLALVVAVLLFAVLLVLLAMLPGAGHRTGHSTPAPCPTAPTRTATVKQAPSTRPCTSHTTPGTPSHHGTPGARLPAGAKTKPSRAATFKTPAAPKTLAAPKARR